MSEQPAAATITCGTAGHDDEGMGRTREPVAVTEGINGIVLLGRSAAFFVSIGHRLTRR